MPLPPVRRLGPAAALALTLVAAGCSGHDDEATGSPSTSPSTTSSSTPSAPTTPSTSPSEPSVAPATGTTEDFGYLSLTIPDSFERLGGAGNKLLGTASFADPTTNCTLGVGFVLDPDGTSLDEAAQDAVRRSKDDPFGTYTRQPDRQVGGQDVYALSSSNDVSGFRQLVGRTAADRGYDISLACPGADPAYQGVFDSVLASAKWKF